MLTHSFDVVRRLLIACALAGGAPLAAGAADHPDEPSTVVSDVHLFVVGEDGSVTEDDATVLRANTPAGIDEIAQRYVWFDRSVAKVDIVDAYAIDRDGVRHTVSPDQIREIQEPRSAGAPTFQDAKLKAVIFPGVGVGSSVYLRFHKSQSTPVVFECRRGSMLPYGSSSSAGCIAASPTRTTFQRPSSRRSTSAVGSASADSMRARV